MSERETNKLKPAIAEERSLLDPLFHTANPSFTHLPRSPRISPSLSISLYLYLIARVVRGVGHLTRAS